SRRETEKQPGKEHPSAKSPTFHPSRGRGVGHGKHENYLKWPSPVTTYLVEVSSSRPIGPRACSFWLEIPISAPKPNSPPSVKRVEAFTITAAASTRDTKYREAFRESVTIASVCWVEWVRMCSRAVSMSGTTRTAMSMERYSVDQSSSVASCTRALLFAARATASTRSSPCTVTSSSAKPSNARGKKSSATCSCTSKVSAALHTEQRWALALVAMSTALSRSA